MGYTSTSKVVLIGKESTWGTPVSPTKDIGLIDDINDNFSREIIESGSVGSIQTQKINTGIVDIGMSISGRFQHGRLLEYAIGTVSHVETTGDWKHTFTVNNTPPSCTVESSEDMTTDTALTSAGMLLESLEISQTLNDVIKFKVDLKGKTTTSSASATAGVISTLVVFPHSWTTITLDATSPTEIQEFSVKITKKVERSGGFTSNLYQAGFGTTLLFEFNGKVGYTNKSIQEIFIGGTSPSATTDPTGIDVIFNSHNSITLGSGRREIYIKLSNCQFDKFEKVCTIGNLIFYTFSGKGTFNTAYTVDNITSANW